MKMNRKKAICAILFCMMLGLFWGCGKAEFNANAYLKALLDNSYKGDSTEFVALELGTEEEALEIYEEGIALAVNDLLMDTDNVDIELSSELIQEYRACFTDIFSKVKYNVKEATALENGAYQVVVGYQTMNVFSDAMEKYDECVADYTTELSKKAVEGESLPEEEELYGILFTMLKDCIKASSENPKYADEQELIVRIDKVNDVYTPDAKAIEELEFRLLGLYQ